MALAQLLISYAGGGLVALVGLAVVIKPANRDGWLVASLMALVWPLTLLVVLAAYLIEERDQ